MGNLSSYDHPPKGSSMMGGKNWDLTFWLTDKVANDNYPIDKPGEGNIVASCGVHHIVGQGYECGKDGHGEPAWDKDAPGYRMYPNSYGDKCDARVYLSKYGGAPPVTHWKAGSTQEVAWAVHATHCGGVGWRLCPLGGVGKDIGNDGATEACFQAGHLKFATNETCIRCPSDPTGAHDRCFEATDKVDYRGNAWRMSMVEYCTDGKNFCKDSSARAKPCERRTGISGADFSMVDLVEVSSDLTPGRYALSWRWDCGETSICKTNPTTQIWSNCAEIEIIAANVAV